MSERGTEEKPDLVVEFGVPIFFGIWAVLGWVAIIDHPFLWMDWGEDPGPDLMPVIVLSLLSFGAAVMLVRAIVIAARRGGTFRSAALGNLAAPFAFAGTLLLVVPAMRWAGFVPAALLFAVAWTFALSDHERRIGLPRRAAEAVIAAGAGVGLIAYLFIHVIHVPLP